MIIMTCQGLIPTLILEENDLPNCFSNDISLVALKVLFTNGLLRSSPVARQVALQLPKGLFLTSISGLEINLMSLPRFVPATFSCCSFGSYQIIIN